VTIGYKEEQIYNELLDEKIFKRKYDNGLEVFFMPKKDYTKKHAFFATEYGALYNIFETKEGEVKEMPLGIAHFLEHKIFEESEGNIFEKFQTYGANVNAFTNFLSTCYMFSTVDHFYDCLDLLMNFVQNLQLTEENVEKEKGIIHQEIKMYDDDPNWIVYFNALRALYNEHPIKHDIAGSLDSVSSTTKEQLEECYKSYYTPDRMIVFIIGDLNGETVFNEVDKHLSETFMNLPESPKLILPEEKKEISKSYVEDNMEVSEPLFYLGFKDLTFYDDTKERLKKGLSTRIALDMVFGRGSNFYEDVYEKGIINSTFSYDFSYGRTFGHTVLGGEAENPEEIRNCIEEEIKSKKETGLDEKAFNRIKKKMIGRHLSSFNSTQYIANTFVSYYMKGINLFDYLEVLEKMEFKEVEDRFKEHFNMDYSILSVVK